LLASGFLAAAFASAQNGLKKASAAWRARSRLTTSAASPCSITKNIRKKESKHEEHDIPGCVTDMLSSIYYVASLPLLPAKTYSFPIMLRSATTTQSEARHTVATNNNRKKKCQLSP